MQDVYLYFFHRYAPKRLNIREKCTFLKKNSQIIWWIQKNVFPLQSQTRNNKQQHQICKPISLSKPNGALVQLVRIHACHAWGHGFESRTHRKQILNQSFGSVAQLNRASDYGSEGYRFESCRSHSRRLEFIVWIWLRSSTE